ncbi:MAG: class I SAM-dependent methyltransferase, partial [Bacteroidota bacterium]
MSTENIAHFFLKNPMLYWTYQGLVGGHKARRWFIEKDVKPQANQKLLDIGCGPGNIIKYLPKVEYLGVDVDEKYIEAAKRRYGDKGDFICTKIEDFDVPDPGTFDIVFASGILHHLDDGQAKAFFEVASKALKPRGRLVTIDGCFIERQHPISKFLLNSDRGEHIRTMPAYEALAKTSFNTIESELKHNYFN